MSSLYLFNLASQYNQWLSTRQTLIAGNIANANTPGFKALDIQPFEAALDAVGAKMTTTQPGHMRPEAAATSGSSSADKGATWEIYHSGNNVSLEQELLKAGEVSRAYSLNTNVMKSFNHMLLTVSKGG